MQRSLKVICIFLPVILYLLLCCLTLPRPYQLYFFSIFIIRDLLTYMYEMLFIQQNVFLKTLLMIMMFTLNKSLLYWNWKAEYQYSACTQPDKYWQMGQVSIYQMFRSFLLESVWQNWWFIYLQKILIKIEKRNIKTSKSCLTILSKFMERKKKKSRSTQK